MAKWRSKGRGTEKSENQINELCLRKVTAIPWATVMESSCNGVSVPVSMSCQSLEP